MGGKWMLFRRRGKDLNTAWSKVARATDDGRLGEAEERVPAARSAEFGMLPGPLHTRHLHRCRRYRPVCVRARVVGHLL